MRTTGDAALIDALRRARHFHRGDTWVATASFVCEAPSCPAALIRVGIQENIGKPNLFNNVSVRDAEANDVMWVWREGGDSRRTRPWCIRSRSREIWAS